MSGVTIRAAAQRRSSPARRIFHAAAGTRSQDTMTETARLDASQTRTLVTLACGAFASQASVRLCDPMLPQLAAELGGTLGQAAQTVTSFTIAYGALQLVHGPMGDRFGKLRVVRYATLAAALASLACMLAASLLQLVALRFLAGATCAALIPLSLAWIGDSVPYSARQRVLAQFMSGSTGGIVFGQVAGGILADTIGWRLSFAFPAAVFLVVGAILAIDARRSARAAALPAGTASTGRARPPLTLTSMFAPFGAVLRLDWARLILVVVFLEGFLVFGALAYVPSWLHLRFDMPLWQCGLAAAGIGVGGLAYALGSSWLIPRLGERGLMIGGAALFAMGMLALGGRWWPLQSLWCALAGMGFYMLHNTLQTFATQMAPKIRGTAIAAFAVGLFAGQSSGVAIGALLVAELGYETVIAGSPVLLAALVAAFAVAVARRQRAAGQV